MLQKSQLYSIHNINENNTLSRTSNIYLIPVETGKTMEREENKTIQKTNNNLEIHTFYYSIYYELFAICPVENMNAVMENMRDSTKEKKTKPNRSESNLTKWNPRTKHKKGRNLDFEDLHTYGQCVVQMQNVQIRTHSMPRPISFYRSQIFPHHA